MSRARLLLPLTAALLLGACAHQPKAPYADIDDTGTIRYIDISGGFYGILADGGQQYDPLNLNPTYQHDGLRVHFTGEVVRGLVTMRLWGRPLRLRHIEKLAR